MAVWTQNEREFILANPQLSAVELWEQMGGLHGTPDSYRKKRKELQSTGAGADQESNADRIKRLGVIADLLERSGIDPAEIGKVERVRLNEWEGFYKDADNEAQKVHMEAASLILSPAWAEGPQWPVVQPSPPTKVYPVHVESQSNDGMETAIILPDPQIGFYRDSADNLHPTHDERALSIALQVARVAKPHRVILIGDVLDFPELSRYRKEPAFVRTTQATIDRATKLLADLRASVPKACSIEWIEGNHEVRIQNYIKDNAAASYGLKRGNLPESWPVLSVPVLCRMDELNVKYHAGYPAVVVWLSDRLKVIHGDKAQQRSNAYAYLDEERVSVLYGHSHRREWAERTRQSRAGPHTILAATPGCLCRIDGVVPGTHSGTDLDGQPLVNWEDWQQGLAAIRYTPGDGEFAYEPISIHHGSAYWRGVHYTASCNVEGQAV